jgi:hypothetical protein
MRTFSGVGGFFLSDNNGTGVNRFRRPRLWLGSLIAVGMLAMAVAMLGVSSAFAQLSSTPREETWITNGAVNAIVTTPSQGEVVLLCPKVSNPIVNPGFEYSGAWTQYETNAGYYIVRHEDSNTQYSVG